VLLAPLCEHERHEQNRRCHQRADDQPAAPALGVAAQQAEDQREQPKREGDQARPVEALGLGIARLAGLGLGEEHGADPDRNVDEEDPLPAESVGERPADQRPYRDRAADRRAPGGDSGAALGALELLGDQRQRGREHRGATDPLEAPREVEEGRVGSQAAEQRSEREHPDADHEQPPPPEAIGERAHGQREGGEEQRVGVHDPLQPSEIGVEVPLDVGKRDVDDGDVQQQHERRQADREQTPPLTFHQAPTFLFA
jgi:hypothetical protein